MRVAAPGSQAEPPGLAEPEFLPVRRGVLALYAFIALIAIAVALRTSYDARVQELKEERAHLASLARALQQHTSLIVEASVDYLGALRDEIESAGGVEAVGPVGLQQMLAAPSSIDKAVRRLYVADRQGRMLATAPIAPREMRGVEPREYFQWHQAHGDRSPRFNPALKSRGSGDWVLPITMRLDNAKGEFDGLVRLSLDVRYLEQFHESLAMSHRGSVALVATDGVFILRHPQMEAARSRPMPPALAGNLRGEEGLFKGISPVDGTPQIYAYRRISGQPVYVVVASSIESVLAEATRRMWIAAATTLAILLVFGVLTRMVLGHLKREQRQLAEIRALNATLEQRVAARTAELMRANAELEAFSYSVSHDLRAPLRHLSGYAGILKEENRAALPGDAARLLDRIVERSDHMGRLIDSLLALSRITRAPLERELLDISGIAREIVDGLRGADPRRPVEVAIEPDLAAQGDRVLVHTLLENLIGNAWKYSSRNPRPRIEIGARVEAGVTVFHVRDNGVGFDMRYAGKLFSPYQRLHAAGEFEGTGIGLATARRIVQRHGGRIWAEAKAAEGATFFFTLPAAEGRAG